MRSLWVIIVATTLLAGCGNKSDENATKNTSNEAAKRVLEQLGDGANNKHIKKD